MSDVQDVASHVTASLPRGLGQRIRLLFATFAVLVVPLGALRLLAADVALVPDAAVALVALVVAGGWALLQYRRRGLPWWADPAPAVALFVAGALGEPGSVFGLMFVLLYGRMLYGTGLRPWANALAYFLAFQAAVGVNQGLAAAFDLGMLTTGLGVVLSATVMRMVGEVIRSHEVATRRDAALYMATSQLQRADDHEEIFEILGQAGLALVDEATDAAFTVWRGDTRTIRMQHGGGAVAHDTPVEASVAQLPRDVQRQLLAGEPFHLDRTSSEQLQQAVGMEATYTAMLMAPLVHADEFAGTLFIGSRVALDADLVTAIGRLAADAGLALARADSAVLLERVVENSSDGIVLLDSSLQVDFASAAAGSLLGRRPEELVGQSIAALLGTGRDEAQQILERVAAGLNDECPLVAVELPDGSSHQVELAVTHMTGTGVDGWVLNLRDVTRRAEVEQALRTSEHRFRSLAENVSEGMYQMTLRPTPSYEYVNPAMEQMCGFPAQAFLDDVDVTLRHVHPDDRALIERTRTSPDELEWPVEARWLHPSGDWVWVSFRESVVHDAEGTVVGSIGIVSDITARKLQEEALETALGREREAAERLRRVDAMRTTFIQAVSHELRTPLTAITGYSQTLHRHTGELDAATHATLLDRLQANASKLDRLLADLLDVDRLASHTIEPTRRQVDVTELVHRVLEQIDGTTHPITCTGGPVTALLDAPKIERVVENLVRNAMKHTEAGTPITVAVEPGEAEDGARVTVADEGPGVPEDLLATIFDPFTQGTESLNAATPGMGIGLSLVARFAEMHGGHARVENRPGGGAAFRVWLPSSPPVRQEPGARRREVPSTAAHARPARRAHDQPSSTAALLGQPAAGSRGSDL